MIWAVSKSSKETEHETVGAMLLLMGVIALAGFGCDVEQTKEGRAPDLDVEVEGDGGELPKYDVDGRDVDKG